MKNILIVFTKNPEEGKVKTRLGRSIGFKNARLICMDLMKSIHDAVIDLPYHKKVSYSGYIDRQDLWDSEKFEKSVQSGEDIGQRMHNEFVNAFNNGFARAVLIGSDIIGLTPEIVKDAFTQLSQADLVLGPAMDGGYYLIGMKQPNRELFLNIDWGTKTVLDQTLSLCDRVNLTCSLLTELSDLDTVDDLQYLPDEFHKKYKG